MLSARSFEEEEEEEEERGQREVFVLVAEEVLLARKGWVFCAREKEREREILLEWEKKAPLFLKPRHHHHHHHSRGKSSFY